MHITDEIISALTAADKPNLSGALFKAKVLAHRLGEVDFANWVNFEISGYPDKESLPNYRLFDMSIRGTVSNGFQIWANVNLSPKNIPSEYKDKVTVCRVSEGVGTIEGWISEGVSVSVPMPYYAYLTYGLTQGVVIQSAAAHFGAQALRSCLDTISNRLLDFVLKISDKLPASGNADLKEISKEVGVAGIFKDTVLHGAIINVAYGSNSVAIQSGNTIQKNDIESLVAAMKELKVSESDIVELKSAVAADTNSTEIIDGRLGKKVQAWATGMLAKAGTTAWTTTVETAAKSIFPALLSYYGIGS